MARLTRVKDKRNSISLMTQFNVISLVILLAGCLLVGQWVTRQIELRVLARVAHTTSLFAGSVLAPDVDRLLAGNAAPDGDRLDPDVLGPEIVAFKIWGPGGVVVHSSNESEIGSVFPVEEGLEAAWEGSVSTEISYLDREEHAAQREIASRLIETYAPIRRAGSAEVAAVIEFYQDVESFQEEIAAARRQTWAIIAGLVGAIYLGLVLLVRRGSRTIERQRRELEQRVQQTEQLLVSNTDLNRRLSAAARRTTTLNEEYLRRIAAELHDGPAQDIGYALLAVGNGSRHHEQEANPAKSLTRALNEIRNISAGLRSPELDDLNLSEVVRRAIAVHRNRTGCEVRYFRDELPGSIHLAVKITVFRVLQEALSNAHLHGGDRSPGVTVNADAEAVVVRVTDIGPGLRNTSATASDVRVHLGLAVMRERVELLGGTLTVSPNQPGGTVVEARLPLLERSRESNSKERGQHGEQ